MSKLARNIPAMLGRGNTLAITSTTKESPDSSLFSIRNKKVSSSLSKINEADANETELSEHQDENENNSGVPDKAKMDHGVPNDIIEGSPADPDSRHGLYEIVNSVPNKEHYIPQPDTMQTFATDGTSVEEKEEKLTTDTHKPDVSTTAGDVYIVSDDIDILEKDDVLTNTKLNLNEHGHNFDSLDTDHKAAVNADPAALSSPEHQPVSAQNNDAVVSD